jgi:hypothetical protein
MSTLCQSCKINGKPRNKPCPDCRLLALEAQNSELIERLNRTPQPQNEDAPEPIETLECKECNQMCERINQLSQMLHDSESDKVKIMVSYQTQLDNLIAMNKKLLSMQTDIAENEEALKKQIHERELALQKAIEEEARQTQNTKINRLAAPKNPKPRNNH